MAKQTSDHDPHRSPKNHVQGDFESSLPKIPLPDSTDPLGAPDSAAFDPTSLIAITLPGIPVAPSPEPHTAPATESPAHSQAPADKAGKGLWLGRSVKTVVTSPDTATGVANVFVSLEPLALSGLILHPICTLWSLWNQFNEKYLSKHSAQPELPSYKHEPVTYAELTGKILSSPGVYRSLLSASFTIAAVESLGRGNVLQFFAFGLMAVGNVGAARILNTSYSAHVKREWLEAGRALTGLQRSLGEVWNKIPERLQSILATPVPPWCIADLMIGLAKLEPSELGSPLVIASCTLAGAGVLSAVIPTLLSGRFHKPSPLSLALTGATNYSLTACNMLFGDPKTCVTLFLWGTASLLFAVKAYFDTKTKNES